MNEKMLMDLHTLLGLFEAYVARKKEPPNWDSDECEKARDLQQAIEDIIRNKKV